MAEQNDQNLQIAEQLLREGRKQEARNSLVEYIRSHPSSTRGWWALSFALTDPKQQIDCVERVLRLDPNYAPARARLEKLKGNIHTQLLVSPFAESAPSQPVIVPGQPARQNSLPSPSQKPAPRPRKETNGQILQYAVLAIMVCMATGIFGFAAVMIVRAYSSTSVPMQPVPSSVPPTSITPILLPPTWTPTPTATLVATYTVAPTNTPPVIPTLVTPTPFVLPTAAVPKDQIAPVEGSYAPDFKLTDVGADKKVSLSNYRGKAVVVFFWATWCQYCEAEMSSMQKVYQAYEDQGLVVLAVDVGESEGKARRYLEAHSLTFPVLSDAESKVSAKYRVSGFPTHFFVDPSGLISSVAVGYLDYSGLNWRVRATLNLPP